MTSKELLTELFNEANRFSCEEPKYTTHDLWEMCKQIEQELEVLETIKANKNIIFSKNPNYGDMNVDDYFKIYWWLNNE